MWVLDYLDDIDSDMSVFHRVDDARATLPAPLYFARAERLSAYRGVMRARAIDEQENGTSSTTSTTLADTPVGGGSDLDRLANEGWMDYEREQEAPL